MRSDLIFKEKSQSINIRKVINIPSLILLAIYGKPEAS